MRTCFFGDEEIVDLGFGTVFEGLVDWGVNLSLILQSMPLWFTILATLGLGRLGSHS
jgi:hypothetical protein